MNIIKQLLYRFIGKQTILSPVYNPFLYDENVNSYCGGSLSNEKVLFVSTSLTDKEHQSINLILKKENAEYHMLHIRDMGTTYIEDEKSIGPYTHIMNYIKIHQNGKEDIFSIYKLLQDETDYLIQLRGVKTICTAVCGNDEDLIKAANSLIMGLGKTLGNHSIICNGIVANQNVDIERIMNCAVFLSGKYGYLLAGETIEFFGDNE